MVYLEDIYGLEGSADVRRSSGKFCEKTSTRRYDRQTCEVVYDNRSVAPYNPWLSIVFDCHINVEVCCNITAVKYIYKSVYKGCDRAVISIGVHETQPTVPTPWNEIKEYKQGRYFGASEASWRLLKFPIHEEFPSVVRLVVHLPEQQQVLFDDNGNIMEVLDKAEHTKLTRWFEFNSKKKEEYHNTLQTNQDAQPHVCLSTLYHNFPRIASWIKTKKWKERKRVVTTDNSIQYSYKNGYPPVGQIYFLDPKEGDRFFLRLLLLKVEGATSFDDLKTTYDDEGIPTIHSTFQDACREMGLLQDDSEWVNCMEASSTFATPNQLRNLFVTILLYNSHYGISSGSV